MMGRLLSLGLAAALALVFAATSEAQVEVRPADGQLWEEVKVAKAYWARADRAEAIRQAQAANGLTPCTQIDAGFAAEPTGAQTAGWVPYIGSCVVRLDPTFATLSRAYPYVYPELRQESAAVIHEVGHALGLGHDAESTFPIMGEDVAAVAGGIYDQLIPGRSRAWARDEVRERRAKIRAQKAARRDGRSDSRASRGRR